VREDMFGIGNEQKAVEVSQAEIEEDIEVVRKLFLKHEKFLRVEESNEGGHFIRAPMLRNLQKEILDALPGRIVMKFGGNPPLVHIFFRDHHFFETTYTERKLVTRVRELEREVEYLRSLVRVYEVALHGNDH